MTFPAARAAFLASLRALLADRTVPEADRIEAAMGVVSAISQMVVVVEMRK